MTFLKMTVKKEKNNSMYYKLSMNKFFTVLTAFVFTSFLGTNAQIVITEFNYQSDSTLNSGDWVELHNPTAAAVDVSGWKMVDGNILNLPYVIPNGTSIPAGGYLVIVDNTTRFDAIHPSVPRIGPLGFEFSNSGEQITLTDNADLVKIQFTYDDSLPWNKCADGLGRTLELKDPTANPSLPDSWRCGCIKGSPGAAFSPCTSETLVISEINYRSPISEEAGDWVEIWNKTNSAVNLAGFRFRDDNNDNFYVFPSGTLLNPQERIVLYNDAVNFTAQHPGVTKKVGPFPFALDGNGDAVRLYNISDRLVQSLWYDDDGVWPKCPDGEGFTLELDTLFTQAQDISDVSSWFCGCPSGSPGTAFVDVCNFSVNEWSNLTEMHIWPNPSNDFISFETTQSGYLELISTDGKRLMLQNLNEGLQQISIQHLAAGMYLLRIQTGDKTAFQRLIKN